MQKILLGSVEIPEGVTEVEWKNYLNYSRLGQTVDRITRVSETIWCFRTSAEPFFRYAPLAELLDFIESTFPVPTLWVEPPAPPRKSKVEFDSEIADLLRGI